MPEPQPTHTPPTTLKAKALQLLDDALEVAGFLFGAAFLVGSAWLYLDVRDTWMFGWIPF